jgi:hypothetical protein
MIKDIKKILFCDEPDDIKLEMLYEFFRWRGAPRSSNIKKFMYNDEIKELVVLFNSGEYYTYYDVEFDRFIKIFQGAGVCRTEGKNKWGEWFVGKTPSAGAAVYEQLVESGIRYTKGGSLR